MLSKFRVINYQYIVKILRGIIELIYEVKPLWVSGGLTYNPSRNNIKISRL